MEEASKKGSKEKGRETNKRKQNITGAGSEVGGEERILRKLHLNEEVNTATSHMD